MSAIKIREATINDLNRCYEIETVSYAGDEAASKDRISKRIATYPEGFIVLEKNKEIAGFINSGATNEIKLADDGFKELIGHDPDGKYVVILSVAVHPAYQGRGFAGQLMKSFITRMTKLNKSCIYLICQTKLIEMYAKYGFCYMGKSESEHGGKRWHEMYLNLMDS